jgi:hypothetical protein
VVPLDYIRLTQEQIVANAKKLHKEIKKEATPVVVGEFKFPEHLRCTKADTDKSREAKRKKVKALKFTHKTAVQEQDHKQRQNEWLKF